MRKIILKENVDVPEIKALEHHKKSKKRERARSERLYHAQMHSYERHYVDKFMHTELTNVVLADDSTFTKFKGRLKSDKLKISKTSEVMVNATNGFYKKLSLATYKNLCKIRYMNLTLTCLIIDAGHEEDDDTPDVFFRKDYQMHSLNQLFKYMITREGIYESMSIYQERGPGWFSFIDIDEVVEVLYKDGRSEKLDFNIFLKQNQNLTRVPKGD